MHSDVNAILVAQRGRMRMLSLIHGDPEGAQRNEALRLRQKQYRGVLKKASEVGPTPATDVKGNARSLTPDQFDAMFGGPKPGVRVIGGRKGGR